jgi:hypothetical protein
MVILILVYLGIDTYKPDWTSLLGEARREYLTWEMSEILLYKEQALYLGEALTPNIMEEEEELPIYEEWILTLAKQLKEKANLYPPDPNQPSIFSLSKNSKSTTKKSISAFIKSAAKFTFWLLALSPIAPLVFHTVIDFLIILAATKYNFLYYLIHYGLIILSFKLLYKISQIKNKKEFLNFIGEIYKNFKDNKWKFVFTFFISSLFPNAARLTNWGSRILATGGLLQTSGIEIAEKAYDRLIMGFRGVTYI